MSISMRCHCSAIVVLPTIGTATQELMSAQQTNCLNREGWETYLSSSEKLLFFYWTGLKCGDILCKTWIFWGCSLLKRAYSAACFLRVLNLKPRGFFFPWFMRSWNILNKFHGDGMQEQLAFPHFRLTTGNAMVRCGYISQPMIWMTSLLHHLTRVPLCRFISN